MQIPRSVRPDSLVYAILRYVAGAFKGHRSNEGKADSYSLIFRGAERSQLPLTPTELWAASVFADQAPNVSTGDFTMHL